MTKVGTANYTWDNNGNLTNDGSANYLYDRANRLISTTLGGVTTQFSYNGDGARLRQVVAGVPTTYTQDLAAPLPVVLQSKTGATTTKYVYSLGTRPLAQNSTAWEYLLPDALGSVRQIADANGNVTLAESYEPYGSVLTSNGTATSIFGYGGEQLDTSGLIYLRARYLQPRLGIFLSRDPWDGDVMQPGSVNGFNYTKENPVNEIDPSGKMSFFSCEYQSNNYPGSSRVYAEGAAAVATGYAGKWGAWIGVEVAYNLDTLERATFDVRGFVIERLSLLGIGRADYVAVGSGKSVQDYGVNNPASDLSRDYRGPFINDCGGISQGAGFVGLLGESACVFRAKEGDFIGESAGIFTGYDVGIPNPVKPWEGLPVAISWYELNYTPVAHKRYLSVQQMAKDILSGDQSPAFWHVVDLPNSSLTDIVKPIRIATAALLYAIQLNKGNLPTYQ